MSRFLQDSDKAKRWPPIPLSTAWPCPVGVPVLVSSSPPAREPLVPEKVYQKTGAPVSSSSRANRETEHRSAGGVDLTPAGQRERVRRSLFQDKLPYRKWVGLIEVSSPASGLFVFVPDRPSIQTGVCLGPPGL